MDRLSPLDAVFLSLEDAGDAMHIGSALIFEGPAPSHQTVVASLAGRMPLVPRYRQRVMQVPGDVGRPVWVDDQRFSIEYHVRRTALPAPGDRAQLRTLTARLMSQRLDRRRPLWEIWVVEGLEGDHWAMVYKVHHCMVDGVAATDLLTVLLDDTPHPPRPLSAPWRPARQPYAVELLADAVIDRVVSPYEQLRRRRGTWTAPRGALSGLGAAVRLARGFAPSLRGSPTRIPSSLNGPIGQYRRWEWAVVALPEVRWVRQHHGGTVNDVVLAVVARGFRDLLIGRGEDVDAQTVRTFVPVSVRAASERGIYNNRVSGVITELPVNLADPLLRLQALRAQMDGLKEGREAVGGEVLTSLTGFAPPLLLTLGARAAARMGQRNINTVTTNVPGPQHPLYSCGRLMLETYPYVGIGANVRITVAVFSYSERLHFGITGDWDSSADLSVLARGIEAGIEELLQVHVRRPARRRTAVGAAPVRHGPRTSTSAPAPR